MIIFINKNTLIKNKNKLQKKYNLEKNNFEKLK